MLTCDALEKVVSVFLRNALAQRYSLDNIRRYSGFDALSDTQIAALRNFGLCHIYPEWDERCFQQEAFLALRTLLDTPMRLKPLVAVALKSMYRFGHNLPRAIDAGKEVVHAFEAMHDLESRLIASLQEIFQAKENLDCAEIIQGIRAIPREAFEKFIDDMVTLMGLLAEHSLLDTAYGVLQDIGAAMEKRQDYYRDIERDGVRYALQVMKEGLSLFDALDEAVIEEAIAEIPKVERDWYDSAILNKE